MAEQRNLVIGLDGTWNDTDSEEEITNVVRLLRALFRRGHVQHYEEGVGTAHWEALPGGVYGEGLDRQILGGYRFLRKRFADADYAHEDNKVFIFGFSRGAYAARRLAGMVDFCGLPSKAADVNLVWELYKRQDEASIARLTEQGRLFPASIEMLGVWDTVKTTNDPDFHDHKLPDCVQHGYHAMAIDEKRRFFPVLRWNANAKVRQVWFAGVHSDVGGGYEERGLADIALRWMIDRAYGHGLRFLAREMRKLDDDPNGQLHDSFQGIWKPLGAKKRTLADSALVHESVRERLQGGTDYSPGNLPNNPNYVSA